jgi:hypothetical protein
MDGMAALQRFRTPPARGGIGGGRMRIRFGWQAAIEFYDLNGGKRSMRPGRQTAVARVTCLRADDRRAKNGVQYGATKTSWCRM